MLTFLIRSLEAAMIFTFAGLGELVDQRAGILNVGLEGIMLFGATLGFIAAKLTGDYWIGFLVGIGIGALLGLLHGFFSITLGVDQVVSGMGIWIFGFGMTTYIGNPFTGQVHHRPGQPGQPKHQSHRGLGRVEGQGPEPESTGAPEERAEGAAQGQGQDQQNSILFRQSEIFYQAPGRKHHGLMGLHDALRAAGTA